jgi:transposase IS116/IS110/IS902 family protein
MNISDTTSTNATNSEDWTDESPPPEESDGEGDEPKTPRELLRAAVRGHYDMQKLRIQSDARTTKKAAHAEAQLSERTKKKLATQAELFEGLERNSMSIIRDMLKEHPISKWLAGVRGCGPTMAGVLISEIDIHRAKHASSIWRYCGLHVVDGQAARRKKGQKLDYNPWLKSKVLKVLGECMIKASYDPKTKEPTKYRSIYDGYKHRLKSMRVPCKACDGTGIAKPTAEEKKGEEGLREELTRLIETLSPLQVKWLRGEEEAKLPKKLREHLIEEKLVDEDDKLTERGQQLVACLPDPDAETGKQGKKKGRAATKKICANCNGEGIGPWGKSDAHRHLAAMRVMVKAFLVDLYVEWRKLEGLPVFPSYAEAKLGIVHGEHASTAQLFQ